MGLGSLGRGILFPLLALAALLLMLEACSEPPLPRKRSFVGSTDGGSKSVNVPLGLNPLGTLDTCGSAAGDAPAGGTAADNPARVTSRDPRVVVSRPEDFTRQASLMIAALRQSLADSEDALPHVEFLTTREPITDAAAAVTEGLRCDALIVLWEPAQTGALELTLPQAASIPLRHMVRDRLCEFGNHAEQHDILYLTIAGLLTLVRNDYDRALLYMEAARQLDDRCLRLPGSGPSI